MLSLRLSKILGIDAQVVREIAKNNFKLLSFETLIQGEGYLLKKIVLKLLFVSLIECSSRVLWHSFKR